MFDKGLPSRDSDSGPSESSYDDREWPDDCSSCELEECSLDCPHYGHKKEG